MTPSGRNGPDNSLNIRILPRRARGRRHFVDAETFHSIAKSTAIISFRTSGSIAGRPPWRERDFQPSIDVQKYPFAVGMLFQRQCQQRVIYIIKGTLDVEFIHPAVFPASFSSHCDCLNGRRFSPQLFTGATQGRIEPHSCKQSSKGLSFILHTACEIPPHEVFHFLAHYARDLD